MFYWDQSALSIHFAWICFDFLAVGPLPFVPYLGFFSFYLDKVLLSWFSSSESVLGELPALVTPTM